MAWNFPIQLRAQDIGLRIEGLNHDLGIMWESPKIGGTQRSPKKYYNPIFDDTPNKSK